MSNFLQWLNSSNGTSLIVALLALFGAFGTTILSNYKADQRRLADQIAEDRRRRSERDAQLVLEETARERREVSQCVEEINKAAEEAARVTKDLVRVYLEKSLSGESAALLEARVFQAQARAEFYLRATNATYRLRLELSQPDVRHSAEELARTLNYESNRFNELHTSHLNALLDVVSNEPIMSADLKSNIADLLDTAFEHLHLSPLDGSSQDLADWNNDD